MSSLPRALPGPRYGSASELAAYAGLSLRTVRRRVADGSLRSVKLGHRVLIPFDAIDRPPPNKVPPMAIAPTPPYPATVDPATGRLRPLTDRERVDRAEALARALDEIDDITDETDTDEVWRDVMRGIDGGRPHRPLFEGSY